MSWQPAIKQVIEDDETIIVYKGINRLPGWPPGADRYCAPSFLESGAIKNTRFATMTEQSNGGRIGSS